jgi:hypothetical protein
MTKRIRLKSNPEIIGVLVDKPADIPTEVVIRFNDEDFNRIARRDQIEIQPRRSHPLEALGRPQIVFTSTVMTSLQRATRLRPRRVYRSRIKIAAQIDEVAVEHLGTVGGVAVDAAVVIRLRQHEALRSELAFKQPVDARDQHTASVRWLVAR